MKYVPPKTTVLLICFFLAAVTGVQADPDPGAPDFTLPFLREKGSMTLSEILPRKEFTVLLVFDGRCAECMDKIAELGDLPDLLHDEGFSAQVLAVNTDREGLGRIRSFIKGEGISFPVLSDTLGRIPELYGCEPYSFSYFILDNKGRLRDHHLDRAPDIRDRIVSGIRNAMNEAAPENAHESTHEPVTAP